MVAGILLDTSVAIELVKKNNQAVIDAVKSEAPSSVSISGVTRFELEVGAQNEDDLNKIRDIPCISVDCASFSTAACIYKKLMLVGKKPSFPDCIIAACAIFNDCMLLTMDKDFVLFEEFGLKMKLLS